VPHLLYLQAGQACVSVPVLEFSQNPEVLKPRPVKEVLHEDRKQMCITPSHTSRDLGKDQSPGEIALMHMCSLPLKCGQGGQGGWRIRAK
jgi:hypothetical protein